MFEARIMSRKALDYDQINENVKKAQYAVRGELYLRASELQKEGKKVRPITPLTYPTFEWDFLGSFGLVLKIGNQTENIYMVQQFVYIHDCCLSIIISIQFSVVHIHQRKTSPI